METAVMLQRFQAAWTNLLEAEFRLLSPDDAFDATQGASAITPAKMALFDALTTASAIDFVDLLTLLGWSAVRMAKALGITSALISQWRSGTRPVARRHSEALGELAHAELLRQRRHVQVDAEHCGTPDEARATLDAFDRRLTLWAQRVLTLNNSFNATIVRCCASLARYGERDPLHTKLLPEEQAEIAYAAAQIQMAMAYLEGLHVVVERPQGEQAGEAP